MHYIGHPEQAAQHGEVTLHKGGHHLVVQVGAEVALGLRRLLLALRVALLPLALHQLRLGEVTHHAEHEPGGAGFDRQLLAAGAMQVDRFLYP